MTEVIIKKDELEAGVLRRAMGRFTTGVAVISAWQANEIHAMTANSICTVSFDPLMVLVCVNKKARMSGFIQEAGAFAINILAEQQEIISRHFAGAGQGEVPGTLHFETIAGTPFIEHTLSSLACQVDRVLDAGDHLMILGRVEAVRYQEEEAAPLVYYRGRYRRLEQTDTPNQAEFWLDSGMRIYYEEW
jgi:flavin reductase (DIM6/NTAB) family NADH-FMN oxidoreductase RutF